MTFASRPRHRSASFLGWLVLLAASCDRATLSRAADGVVSLSPAATDLVVAIGGRDRLVGVSTYDTDPRTSGLPRVGDYENVDWERIRSLAPRTLITQLAPARMSAGFVAEARGARIAICSIHIDRLADVGVAMQAIGDAIGLSSAATQTWAKIDGELGVVRKSNDGRPRVRTLIVTSDDGLSVAGVETFLDDLLTIAGGINAVGPSRPLYFKLDREQLLQLNPSAILVLIPDATPSIVDRVKQTFDAMPDLAAVRLRQVRFITRSDVLQPNANVVATAREFSDAIRDAR